MGRLTDARKKAKDASGKKDGAERPPETPGEEAPEETSERLTLPPYGLAEDIIGQDASSPTDAAAVDEPEEESTGSASDVPEPAAQEDDGSEPETESVETGDLLQLVTFYLGREEYALTIEQVREINRVGDITRVPNAPDHVRGVINLRGRIIPVIELKHRLKLGDTVLSQSSRVVVVESGNRMLGLIVDGVSRVLSVSARSIEEAPDEVVQTDENYVKGVCKVEDAVLIQLDLDRVVGAAA